MLHFVVFWGHLGHSKLIQGPLLPEFVHQDLGRTGPLRLLSVDIRTSRGEVTQWRLEELDRSGFRQLSQGNPVQKVDASDQEKGQTSTTNAPKKKTDSNSSGQKYSSIVPLPKESQGEKSQPVQPPPVMVGLEAGDEAPQTPPIGRRLSQMSQLSVLKMPDFKNQGFQKGAKFGDTYRVPHPKSLGPNPKSSR